MFFGYNTKSLKVYTYGGQRREYSQENDFFCQRAGGQCNFDICHKAVFAAVEFDE